MYIFIFLLFGITAAQAQPIDSIWSHRYNFPGPLDVCERLIQTSDGGYLLGGWTQLTDRVLKTNAIGDSLWSASYASVVIEDMTELPDQSVVLASALWRLIHTNNFGDTIWTRDCRVDSVRGVCHALIQTPDGGFLFAGSHEVWEYYSHVDISVVKTDSAGNIQWIRFLDSPITGYECYDLTNAIGEGYVIAGATNGTPMLAKVDAGGEPVWEQTYSGTDFRRVLRIGNGYVAAGLVGSNPLDVGLAGTDSLGNLLWNRVFDMGGDDYFNDLIEAPDGGLMLAGTTIQSGQGIGWLLRTDEVGDSLWTVTMNVDGSFSSLVRSADNGYVVAGTHYGNWSDSLDGWQFWLVRFTAEGVPISPLPPGVTAFYALNPNYPNPFNSTTSISYDLPRASHVSLNVFDITGRTAATLVEEMQEAGQHHVNFNANDLPSGIYVYRLSAGGFQQSRKLVVLK